MVRGYLGHSNHKMIEFLILGEVRRGMSRTAALADRDLFRSLVERLPWKVVLKSKGVQEDFKKRHSWRKSHRYRSRPSPCAKRWVNGKEDWPAWTETFNWNSSKKWEFMTIGRTGRQLRMTASILWIYVGRKLEGPKLNKNLIWLMT